MPLVVYLPDSDWYSPMYLLVRYLTVSADFPTWRPPMTTSFTERSTSEAPGRAADEGEAEEEEGSSEKGGSDSWESREMQSA